MTLYQSHHPKSDTHIDCMLKGKKDEGNWGFRVRNGGPFPLTVFNICVSNQVALLFGNVCSFEVWTKGPRVVYVPIGVRGRILSWNFSVRCLVHRLGLPQRGKKERADLRSARHLARRVQSHQECYRLRCFILPDLQNYVF